MIEYSFDDHTIGKLSPNRKHIMSQELRRPPGLNISEWYVLAKQICELLNSRMKDR